MVTLLFQSVLLMHIPALAVKTYHDDFSLHPF
jgi:hypothetical protein